MVRRIAVRFYNYVLFRVPFALKYGVGKRLRSNRLPYSIVKPGSVVVQIGAPKDTLDAGRSRGIFFSLFAGQQGKVVIIEPEKENVRHLAEVTEERELKNVIICPVGAWSEKTELNLFVSESHPASNFTEGSVDGGHSRDTDHRAVGMPVDTVDNILAERGITQVDLVSVTTNGAEVEILKGVERTISSGVPYIALARTGSGYEEIMKQIGYRLDEADDRGMTFRRGI